MITQLPNCHLLNYQVIRLPPGQTSPPLPRSSSTLLGRAPICRKPWPIGLGYNTGFDTTVFPKVSVLNLETNTHQTAEHISLPETDRPVGLPSDSALAKNGAPSCRWLNSASNDISVIDVSNTDPPHARRQHPGGRKPAWDCNCPRWQPRLCRETVGVGNINFTSFTCNGAHAAVSAPARPANQFPTLIPYRSAPTALTRFRPGSLPATYPKRRFPMLPSFSSGTTMPTRPNCPFSPLATLCPCIFPGRCWENIRWTGGAGLGRVKMQEITPCPIVRLRRLSAASFRGASQHPRTGELLVYQLEPGSHWLSATDSALPQPPAVSPLEPATGTSTASIQRPDGRCRHAWPVRLQPDLPTHSHQSERG